MVKNLISRANTKIPVGKAAALIAGSYFLSALLGLVRDRLLASKFGIGGTLDAYFAAFSVPDLMFYLLVSGALSVTFIPVLTDRLINHNKKSAWELSSSLLNLLALITFVASVLIFVFADQIMWAVAPSFDADRHELAVSLTRIIAINPFLFSISSVFASMQQAFGRFFFYALAPIFYNIGIILGIVFLTPLYGIGGVALGVVAGALLQLIVQRLGIIGIGFDYKRKIFWKNQGFRQVIKLMIPRSIDEGVEHLNAVVERAIASGLAIGSVAAYQYAFNLKNMPVTLIGVAIATAVFPKFSQKAAQHRTDLLRYQFLHVVRVMLWLLLPTAALFVVLRGYIVRLLFGFGDPTTASILGWFAGAIIFQSILRVAARVFYAEQDTKTPLYTSIFALVINVPLAIWLTYLYGVKGLAMAQSLVAGVELALLLILTRRRIGKLINLRSILYVIKTVVATTAAAATAYLLVRYPFPLLSGEVGFWSLAPKFLIIGSLSVISYLFVGWILQLPEAKLVISKINGFVFKRLQIQ